MSLTGLKAATVAVAQFGAGLPSAIRRDRSKMAYDRDDSLTASSAAGGPRSWMASYLRKMRGTTRGSPPRVSNAEVLWSWVGAFLGIGAVALVSRVHLGGADQLFMIGSLGASAVLVYGAPRSPLAQPRNLVGGHLISAAVGVLCFKLLGTWPGVAEAMAVASAIALMHLTRTLHPPGGATALIAVIGSDQLHLLGYAYVIAPAGAGAVILLLVALLVNNAVPGRRYPEYWI
jgi:CBS-domain-containing membrane protein